MDNEQLVMGAFFAARGLDAAKNRALRGSAIAPAPVSIAGVLQSKTPE
jgi:hypothetical protein